MDEHKAGELDLTQHESVMYVGAPEDMKGNKPVLKMHV